eukprot:TRINITY_DN11421_c0_g1_i1.p1 TRINITY_DN11421_c0_g1~~TRINITY_DN11421_c0_g1_i1.p1  ORF type:complete len:335 (-),score=41.67 TRINITY_DN11421_c0_g1_i1:152-1156(-)
MKLSSTYLQPLQEQGIRGLDGRVHCKLNLNTETGRLSCRNPNLQQQPAYEKDVKYQVRRAFVADKAMKFIVLDYGQLELRILAHLSKCKSMIQEFAVGGDLHSRTAYAMFQHIKDAVKSGECVMEHKLGDVEKHLPTIKERFQFERQQAKTLNFSIAYGKTAKGLSEDWKVSLKEAKNSLKMWYKARPEVEQWQEDQKELARKQGYVQTILGRRRDLKALKGVSAKSGVRMTQDLFRKAINSPVQGSAADVVMLAMLRLHTDPKLKELGWRQILQIHDEVILEGPCESANEAQDLIVECMSKPFWDHQKMEYCNPLKVALVVESRICDNWYQQK